MLPIYLLGNPVLRRESKEIDLDYPELNELIEKMFETMYKANGVGWLRLEVGLNIRLFVMDTNPYIEAFPDVVPMKRVMINPVIEEELGEPFTFAEGCLSVPEVYEEVTRKSEIKIRFLDLDGEEKVEHVTGLNARVMQHETDHLDGKVFTDRVSPIKKMILKKKLQDISAGKVKVNYKFKN